MLSYVPQNEIALIAPVTGVGSQKQEREQALWEARKQIKEQQQATVRKHGVQLLSGVRALKPSFNQLKKDLEGMAGEVTKCVRQGVSHLTQIRDQTESELDRVTEKVLAARRAKEVGRGFGLTHSLASTACHDWCYVESGGCFGGFAAVRAVLQAGMR